MADPRAIKVNKVIVIGDAGVGKTSIVQRATTNAFQETYSPTVGAGQAYLTVHTDALGSIRLQIWDTAGQDCFNHLQPLYAKGAAGIVVVFDLTQKSSFDHLDKWFELTGADTSNCEIVLVGNKVDMDERVIEPEEAEHYADTRNCQYIEVSAKTGQRISDVFQIMGELILEYPKPEMEVPVNLPPGDDGGGGQEPQVGWIQWMAGYVWPPRYCNI
jgi:small GTP-binding protein